MAQFTRNDFLALATALQATDQSALEPFTSGAEPVLTRRPDNTWQLRRDVYAAMMKLRDEAKKSPEKASPESAAAEVVYKASRYTANSPRRAPYSSTPRFTPTAEGPEWIHDITAVVFAVQSYGLDGAMQIAGPLINNLADQGIIEPVRAREGGGYISFPPATRAAVGEAALTNPRAMILLSHVRSQEIYSAMTRRMPPPPPIGTAPAPAPERAPEPAPAVEQNQPNYTQAQALAIVYLSRHSPDEIRTTLTKGSDHTAAAAFNNLTGKPPEKGKRPTEEALIIGINNLLGFEVKNLQDACTRAEVEATNPSVSAAINAATDPFFIQAAAGAKATLGEQRWTELRNRVLHEPPSGHDALIGAFSTHRTVIEAIKLGLDTKAPDPWKHAPKPAPVAQTAPPPKPATEPAPAQPPAQPEAKPQPKAAPQITDVEAAAKRLIALWIAERCPKTEPWVDVFNASRDQLATVLQPFKAFNDLLAASKEHSATFQAFETQLVVSATAVPNHAAKSNDPHPKPDDAKAAWSAHLASREALIEKTTHSIEAWRGLKFPADAAWAKRFDVTPERLAELKASQHPAFELKATHREVRGLAIALIGQRMPQPSPAAIQGAYFSRVDALTRAQAGFANNKDGIVALQTLVSRLQSAIDTGRAAFPPAPAPVASVSPTKAVAALPSDEEAVKAFTAYGEARAMHNKTVSDLFRDVFLNRGAAGKIDQVATTLGISGAVLGKALRDAGVLESAAYQQNVHQIARLSMRPMTGIEQRGEAIARVRDLERAITTTKSDGMRVGMQRELATLKAKLEEGKIVHTAPATVSTATVKGPPPPPSAFASDLSPAAYRDTIRNTVGEATFTAIVNLVKTEHAANGFKNDARVREQITALSGGAVRFPSKLIHGILEEVNRQQAITTPAKEPPSKPAEPNGSAPRDMRADRLRLIDGAHAFYLESLDIGAAAAKEVLKHDTPNLYTALFGKSSLCEGPVLAIVRDEITPTEQGRELLMAALKDDPGFRPAQDLSTFFKLQVPVASNGMQASAQPEPALAGATAPHADPKLSGVPRKDAAGADRDQDVGPPI